MFLASPKGKKKTTFILSHYYYDLCVWFSMQLRGSSVVYKFIFIFLFTCDKALWGFEQTKNVTMTIWFQMSNDFTV